jgi:hypothetical protein
MNVRNMRRGLATAHRIILERFRAREPWTSVVKPTRYGKRDLIITAAWEAVQQKLISGAIVFSPATQATRQFFKESKLLETIARYELPIAVLKGVRQLERFTEYQPFSNREFLLAVNTQLCLRTNITDVLELINAEHARTGLPLAIFIDECHFVGEQKRWGQFFGRISEAGVLVVLLTAVPYREDADVIPGFRAILLDEQDERRYFTFDAGDGIHNRIELWGGTRTVTMLEADDVTTFREAWDELPEVLCKLDREVYDIELEGLGLLSQLSPAQTYEHLGRIVRSRRFLDPALRIVLDKLRGVQTINPQTKAMIVTGNDQPNDRRDDAHAKTIRELIQDLSPTILGRAAKVRIITLKSLEDDSAAEVMEAFLDGDEDLVIVKQVGTVGLDDWRLKVMGYFSPVRSLATMINTWMRVATPHAGLTISSIVMPADILSAAIWQKLVVEEGGEAQLGAASGWSAETMIDEFLKKKPEPKEDAIPELSPGFLSGYDDSMGNVGDLDFYEQAKHFFEMFPLMRKSYTMPQVADQLKKKGGFPPGQRPGRPDWGLPRELSVLYDEINEAAKAKAKRWMFARTGGAYAEDVYRASIRAVYTIVYRSLKIPPGADLRDITNIETLRQMHALIVALPDTPSDA